MIKLTCNDDLFNSAINGILLQKNLINDIELDNYYANIKIDIKDDNLYLDSNGTKKNLSLPIDINHFFGQVLKIISDIKISKDEYDYFPYQRVLLRILLFMD